MQGSAPPRAGGRVLLVHAYTGEDGEVPRSTVEHQRRAAGRATRKRH
jgi:hypothetical protein